MKVFWVAILFVALGSLACGRTTSAVATYTLHTTSTLLPNYTEYPVYTPIPTNTPLAFVPIFWHNYTDDRRYQ
jgi:hypothetical protein